MTSRRLSDVTTGLLLALATVAQLADVYTWKLMLASRLGQELNPVVIAATRLGIAEVLKLGIIVWVLSFAVLMSPNRLWPAVVAVALFIVGLVGTLSNLRAIS